MYTYMTVYTICKLDKIIEIKLEIPYKVWKLPHSL